MIYDLEEFIPHVSDASQTLSTISLCLIGSITGKMNFVSQLHTDLSVLVGGTNIRGTSVFPASTFPFDTSLKAFKSFVTYIKWNFLSLHNKGFNNTIQQNLSCLYKQTLYLK